ncbi:MAG TPA: hypothetical protein PK156_34850 [Polyangium sp.]|nr:hypothetical protein [Polyangium sp.]
MYFLLGCAAACTPPRTTPDSDAKSPTNESTRATLGQSISAPDAVRTLPESASPSLQPEKAPPADEATSTASITGDKPTEHFTIADDQGRPIEVYPPISNEPRAPFVVLLHATCMQPAWVCDWFGNAGRDNGWLVCPSGNSTCAGEPDWHGPGPEKAGFLENALRKVEARVPTFVDEESGVLIGWSRGAFAARDILYAALDDPQSFPHAKRFRGLVLMAAAVKPDPSKLRRAGIMRVVMAAGDYDGAKSTMVSAANVLRAGGLEVRYVSLGKIAHVWPNDFETLMREPIAWAGQKTRSEHVPAIFTN